MSHCTTAGVRAVGGAGDGAGPQPPLHLSLLLRGDGAAAALAAGQAARHLDRD